MTTSNVARPPKTVRLVVLLVAATSAALAQTPAQQREVDNVAAFARLYGVARYFYPSDAAAALDWNRFAVYGVSRVRSAPNAAALERTLEELFTPLGPGIEIAPRLSARPATGGPDPMLVAWRYRGAAMSGRAGPYIALRTNRSAPASNETAILAQSVRAASLRGKAIRLRGRMRVPNPNVTGWTGLWLRVDRAQQQVGFFDNMQKRPVRDTAWREYVIEGTVADDATTIVFGALAVGLASADVDALDLAVRSDAGDWTTVPISDPGFEAQSVGETRWSQSNPARNSFARLDAGAPQGRRFLRMTVEAGSARQPSEQWEIPSAGAVADVDLTPRLKARIPLALTDSQAAIRSAVRSDFWSAVGSAVRSDSIAADVVVAWNVFLHFYPYWPETRVDWGARLRPHLEAALRAEGSRTAHRDVLRALVADARDGHGSVTDVNRGRMGALPIQLRVLDGKAVVIASRVPEARVGAVVTAIDGVDAADRVASETRLASGAPQWQEWRAMREIAMCSPGTVVKLTLEYPLDPVREAALACGTSRPPTEPRPDSIAELEPGLWYVDLTRVTAAKLRPRLEALASAKGVVFDVRGYPTDAGAMILPHLLDAAESDKWMHVPKIVAPFGQIFEWQDFSWDLKPAEPRIAAQRVFLTDGRAISYAESVMGYVGDYRLGTIIGGPTAGTNGNVASFVVPGEFQIVFTGMRVTRHDGRSPFHLTGVQPDIPLEPTLTSLRAGKDELLERALAILREPRARP